MSRVKIFVENVSCCDVVFAAGSAVREPTREELVSAFNSYVGRDTGVTADEVIESCRLRGETAAVGPDGGVHSVPSTSIVEVDEGIAVDGLAPSTPEEEERQTTKAGIRRAMRAFMATSRGPDEVRAQVSTGVLVGLQTVFELVSRRDDDTALSAALRCSYVVVGRAHECRLCGLPSRAHRRDGHTRWLHVLCDESRVKVPS